MNVGDEKKINGKIIQKISRTICAIANNGPNSDGKIIIGVADKDNDAKIIEEIDKITPKIVGSRYVVGVNREANRIGISIESYVKKIGSSRISVGEMGSEIGV